MFKALLKKQLLELNRFYFEDKKTGKRRSKGGVIGYILVFAFLMLALCATFFGVSMMLLEGLAPMGMTRLFFSIMGLMSLMLGTFGSVFNTYAGLYQAKDNETLLAMPIPPMLILSSRLCGVYLMSLMYSGIVWLPACIGYWIYAHPSVGVIVLDVVLFPILGLLVTVLTCILGLAVAVITRKLKNKSLFTVLFSLIFLAAYYFICMRFNLLLQSMIRSADRIDRVVRAWLFPIDRLGRAAEGSVLSALIFALIVFALFAACCYVMARSFIRIVTSHADGKKAVYRGQTGAVRSVDRALLMREFKRFMSSPTYMLNCGLGLVVLPVLAIILLIKAPQVRQVLGMLGEMGENLSRAIPAMGAAAVCLALSMNCVCAPSVSLEGKNIWIVQSLPVAPKRVLGAKVRMHLLLNLMPMLICTVIVGVVLSCTVWETVAMVLLCASFVWFTGLLGLMLDLKKPRLSWTSETVPVKQNMSVAIVLLGGWFLSVAMGGGALLIRGLPNAVYLLLCAAVLAICSVLLTKWKNGRGARIFSEL